MAFETNIPGHFDIAAGIQKSRVIPGFGNLPPARLGSVDNEQTVSFSQMMNNMVDNLNTQMNEPDNMLKDVMSGNKNVDIHDVMTAMSKAEISISIATQVTGKVIQAYDRIMQINV